MSTIVETLPRLLTWTVSVDRRAAPVSAAVFLPREHGSWSLAFEPLALGLLVAPSAAGIALVATAMAAFFARRPLKGAWATGASSRRSEARGALVMLLGLAVVGTFEVIVLGDSTALWPLGLALPFAALFAYFDAHGEGRAAAAELAGSTAFALLPATFATLAGWPGTAALILAALALVRSIPTVLTIRTFLRQRKGEPVRTSLPIFSSASGLGLVLLLAGPGRLPWPATAGALLLLVRTLWLTGSIRPAWTARRAGMTEAALGLAYLALVAGGYAWGGTMPPAP